MRNIDDVISDVQYILVGNDGERILVIATSVNKTIAAETAADIQAVLDTFKFTEY